MWIWGMHSFLEMVDTGFFGWNLWLFHIFTKFRLNSWMWVNKIALAFKYCMWDNETLYNFVTKNEKLSGGIINNVSVISETIFELLERNTLLQAIIFISTTLSVVAALVKYGYVIFKTYFLNLGNQASLSPLDAFKKLLITLIIALIFPTITINMFYGATVIGNIIGNQIYEAAISNGNVLDSENVSNDLQLKYYIFNQKYGITPSTYCNDWSYKTRKNEEKVTTSEGPYAAKYNENLTNNNSYSIAIPPENKDNPDVKIMWTAFCENKLTNKYNIDVKQYEADQKVFHFLEPSSWGESEIYKWKDSYPALVGQTLIDKVNPESWLLTADGHLNMINIVVFLIRLVFSLWLMINTTKHIANLFGTLLMSWYYIQGYFEPENNGVLGALFKRIFSASLTQVFTMMMFGIYLGFFVTNSGISFVNIIISLVLIFAMVGGSQSISEIVDMSDLKRGNIGSVASKATRVLN